MSKCVECGKLHIGLTNNTDLTNRCNSCLNGYNANRVEELEARVTELTEHLDKINRHYLIADEIAGYVEIDTDLLKPIAALIQEQKLVLTGDVFVDGDVLAKGYPRHKESE